MDLFTTYLAFIIAEVLFEFTKSGKLITKGMRRKLIHRILMINLMMVVHVLTGNFFIAVSIRTWALNNLRPKQNLEKARVTTMIVSIGTNLLMLNAINLIVSLPFIAMGTYQYTVFASQGYSTGSVIP
jgi:hypothetical protein